ncbi:MAG TPA: GNAT family N-acetyltransferase [Xanthobacteraceae bacterium]|nr:GNAT family N-acetyltransferase [Xanthobacteraceae bacterium]
MPHLDWLNDLQMGGIKFSPVRRAYQGYIYSLRTNPLYNRHLSPPPASAEKQGDWIDGYVQREARGEEFYFLIERQDGCPCGTVRLYDFRQNSFCWGSWILDENKTRFSAVESALLVYKVGFEKLGFTQSHFDVRVENTKVIRFHERMGAVRTEVLGEDQHMRITRGVFEIERPKLIQVIQRHIHK